MALVGVSLVLADRAGVTPAHFWRRIGVIAACALAASVGSWIVFPRTFIYFGILHGIAVASVLALARSCAGPDRARASAASSSPPGFGWSHPAFDARPLSWIGFVTAKPATEDYVPLAPWAGFVLLGIALGHALARDAFRALAPLAAAPALAALARTPQPRRLHGPPADPARRALARRRGHEHARRALPDTRLLWALYAVAALSFATTLTLPYIGEEGIYTITAMEMKVARAISSSTRCTAPTTASRRFSTGSSLPLADGLGWEHVLVASRRSPPCATIATGLVLAWLVAALTEDKRLCRVRGARLPHERCARSTTAGSRIPIRCSRSSRSRRSPACGWRPRGGPSRWCGSPRRPISCAALTKGQSAYVFYAVAAARAPVPARIARAFCCGPAVLVPHLAAAALYFVWHRAPDRRRAAEHGLDRHRAEAPGVRSRATICISSGGFRWKRRCASCPRASSPRISGCARNLPARTERRHDAASRSAHGSRA